MVSCTLNQILSNYIPGSESFASLVRKALSAGLTEPDPRVDLGGEDALRKLLILSREAGVKLESADVSVTPVVPASLFEGSVEDFLEALEAYEPSFQAEMLAAERQGFRRRFVASLEKVGPGSTAVDPGVGAGSVSSAGSVAGAGAGSSLGAGVGCISGPVSDAGSVSGVGSVAGVGAGGYRAGIGLRNVPPVHPAYHLKGTENAIIIRSAFHPYPLIIEGPGEGPRDAASSILNDILR